MTESFEELVSIPVDGVRLEGRLAYPENRQPTCAALIIGAHPLLGGNMNNNVTTALRFGLAERGAAALTFEYRRPTEKDGAEIDWSAMLSDFWRTSHVAQEPAWRGDAGAALKYLQRAVPGPIVLIGYSFGCWALAELSAQIAAAALVCISPNPNDHDLGLLKSGAGPLLVVSSDNDFSCTPEKLKEWYDSLSGPKELICFPSAEHFFRGREDEVVRAVADLLLAHGLIED